MALPAWSFGESVDSRTRVSCPRRRHHTLQQSPTNAHASILFCQSTVASSPARPTALVRDDGCAAASAEQAPRRLLSSSLAMPSGVATPVEGVQFRGPSQTLIAIIRPRTSDFNPRYAWTIELLYPSRLRIAQVEFHCLPVSPIPTSRRGHCTFPRAFPVESFCNNA